MTNSAESLLNNPESNREEAESALKTLQRL